MTRARGSLRCRRDVRVGTPFLKWAGGKGRLVPVLRELLPVGIEQLRHVEPFAGGAALFFAQATPRALLADVNAELVQTYVAVRDDLTNVIAHLEELQARHGPSHYYEVRAHYNARRHACPAELAAHFIYLNKTCYNGLYRVNRAGEFNVPLGRYAAPAILDRVVLTATSERLQGVSLEAATFERTLSQLGSGDFVYLDPPYEPASPTANFCGYARGGFDRGRQEALAGMFADLHRRGARAMLSNSDTPFTRALYRGWPVRHVRVLRSVSRSCAGRVRVGELIVTSYPQNGRRH